jgi:hypothetical protein
MDDRNRPHPLYLMKVRVVKIDALLRRACCSSNDALTPRQWGASGDVKVDDRKVTIG